MFGLVNSASISPQHDDDEHEHVVSDGGRRDCDGNGGGDNGVAE